MRVAKNIESHPVDLFNLPSQAEQKQFIARGIRLDILGRPVHPWATSLPDIESNLGKGDFYHWGPNKTVDPIVITNEIHPHILLIRRQDTGEWALPGGFIDNEEHVIDAAQRELYEETSLILHDVTWRVCFSGPVVDPRATRNAWPETTALVTQIMSRPTPTANDDALHAEWISLSTVPDLELYGSHKELIEYGLRTLSN